MRKIIYEIFNEIPRLGPGNLESTKKALSLIRTIPEKAKILDVGCGTGASTFALSKLTDARICALDNHKTYLDEIDKYAKDNDLSDQITTIHSDMIRLPFPENFFDIIWAEGSIYNIGFEKGLKIWKKNLKSSGYIACTEISWLQNNPPEEIKEFWDAKYPEMNTVRKNIELIEQFYTLINYFTLPEKAWFDSFYTPLKKRISLLRNKYEKDEQVLNSIDAVELEILMFEKYSNSYGYVFYIMQKK